MLKCASTAFSGRGFRSASIRSTDAGSSRFVAIIPIPEETLMTSPRSDSGRPGSVAT